MPFVLPNTQFPPTRSDFSKQSKAIPRSCRALAAAIPEDPAPMMQTFSDPSLEPSAEGCSSVPGIAESVEESRRASGLAGADAGTDVLRRALGAAVGVRVAGETLVV